MTTNHLTIAHAHRELVLNRLCALRGDLNNKSKRSMHRDFVLDETNHKSCLEEAFRITVRSNSIDSSLNRLYGNFVLIHIRDSLIESAEEIRENNLKVHQTRIFDKIKLKNQMHQNSRFGDICASQVSLFQIAGAEFEAFAMILHQQRTNPGCLQIVDDDGNDLHDLFKLSTKVENAIDDLRVMFTT